MDSLKMGVKVNRGLVLTCTGDRLLTLPTPRLRMVFITQNAVGAVDLLQVTVKFGFGLAY